jgi:hypothetical protein
MSRPPALGGVDVFIETWGVKYDAPLAFWWRLQRLLSSSACGLLALRRSRKRARMSLNDNRTEKQRARAKLRTRAEYTGEIIRDGRRGSRVSAVCSD